MSTGCHGAAADQHRTRCTPTTVNASSQTVLQPQANNPDSLTAPENAPTTISLSTAALTARPVAADGAPGHLNRQHLKTSEATVHLPERYNEETGTRLFNSAQHEEICQLCEIFKRTLLVHIPILALHDIDERVSMIDGERWLLAFSTAYVAASFIPGCREIQKLLVDPIRDGLRISSQSGDDGKRWTALQALAVLYNWTKSGNLLSRPGRFDANDFDSETLRMLWYDVARGSNLHESAESVARVLQQQGNLNIHHDMPCRKYLQWLWMFATTHFRALLTRGVPIIKPDRSIYSSTYLLRDYLEDHQMRRILSQVELCLIWFQPTLLESGFWDWSLSQPTLLDVDALPDVPKDLEEALDGWALKWCPDGRSQCLTDIVALIHYNFAGFCVNVHSIKLLATLKTARKAEITSLNLLTNSVERCYNLCTSVLGLNPLEKYSVTFAPEWVFIMILHARDYVIEVHQSSKHSHIVQPYHLNALQSLSNFMLEGGISATCNSQTYGHSLADGGSIT